MKLRAHRERLFDAFTAAASVVAPRSIKPVLQKVRFQVSEGQVVAIATDLEVAVRYHVPVAGVKEPGDVLLPAARILGILRESPADEVEIEGDDSTLEIRCGGGTFKVQVEAPNEFPEVKPFEEQNSFTLDRDAFRMLIAKTAFAAAKERTRFAFNGVRFDVQGGIARMVATDGKRLAVKSCPVEGSPDQEARIIPTKGLATFSRLLRDGDVNVGICLDKKQAMIRTEHVEVTTRLVEGTFPDYRSVLPAKTPYEAEFSAIELRNALKQASILTNEESRSVRFSFEEGRAILTSRAVDVGEARIEIETNFTGQPISVSYNPDYLLEGLKVLDAETVTLKLSGQDTPSLLEGEENFIYLVMPVTLRTG